MALWREARGSRRARRGARASSRAYLLCLSRATCVVRWTNVRVLIVIVAERSPAAAWLQHAAVASLIHSSGPRRTCLRLKLSCVISQLRLVRYPLGAVAFLSFVLLYLCVFRKQRPPVEAATPRCGWVGEKGGAGGGRPSRIKWRRRSLRMRRYRAYLTRHSGRGSLLPCAARRRLRLRPTSRACCGCVLRVARLLIA